MARPRKIDTAGAGETASESLPEIIDAAPNDTLAEAFKKSMTVKKDKIYPPKIRKMNPMFEYSGANMADFAPDREMKHGDFTGMDLSGADFTGFNLQGSIFRNANITGTIFRDADVRWSDFQGCINPNTAIWSGANIKETLGLPIPQ